MSEINQVLSELDALFSLGDTEKIREFLENKIALFKENKSTDNLITMLNEMIGFCRDMGEFDKGSRYCDKLFELVNEEPYKNSIPYATTLLNIANFKRAKKDLAESEKLYLEVPPIYNRFLTDNDFQYASYYNNLSLLYQEMNQYTKAAECLKKALVIAKQYEEARIEVATTHTNLANCYLKLRDITKAKEELEEAFAIFEQDTKKDYHYGGALSAMAEICVLEKDYDKAAEYYEKTLVHLEMYTGKNTPQYKVVLSNLESIKNGSKSVSSKKGLQLCREYFKQYGMEMLKSKFPDYVDRITAGLVGEGSDCFGFDDETSKDHDFGPRFCLWVSKETYKEIGEKLQKAYDELPDTFEGYTRNMTVTGKFRQGVMVLEDFVEHLLFTRCLPKTDNDWMLLPENGLAALSNGEIWLEGDGRFTDIRKTLEKYPDSVRWKKIIQSIHLVRQMGLYNYFRMKERGENIAAEISLAGYMENVMKVVYYLNNVYPPFYKWLHRGMDNFPILAEIMDILNALNDHRGNADTVKGIMQVVEQLLEYELNEDKKLLIENIIALEWEAFDKVDNEGGRADCQDDYETFYIMRKSQYLTWNIPLLQSFLNDLQAAKEAGWNMISEKYARMMESTCKEEYDKLKDRLPFVSEEKKAVAEQIVVIQVGFMEEFAKEFPKVAGNARVIHTSEDTFFRTSYETYLRGELLTYSDDTLKLYGQFIVSLAREKKNLAKMIMENTAHMYGYKDLSEI